MAEVIGLDIGTTSTIAVRLDLTRGVVASASRPVTLSSPHPGWAEEDPAQWWDNACAVLSEVAGATPAAICVTGMLPAVVLLDAEGEGLRPSIQQSDGRCAAEVEGLRAELDEVSFIARTGNGINQQLVAAKLRWLARAEPGVFAQIATVCGSYDYINWRLTGRRCVEANWALEAGFIDLSTGRIAPDLVALAGIGPAAVPDRVLPHQVIGHVTAAAAAATGLPEGLPVMGGAADHIASALAAGVTRPGDVLLKFGGAGDVVVASECATPDPRLYLDYHLVPGLFAPNGCMAASGAALNWLAGLIAEPQAHARLDALAAEVPAGADGVLCLPYFLGEKTPIHDPLARGTFTGLSLGHGPGHLWRAMLEAVAHGFRHHLDVLTDMGHAPRRVLVSDGGAKSQIWMQIVADVIGLPVTRLAADHGSAMGAAFVAAMGAGLAQDWAEIERLSPRGETLHPDPATRSIHDAVHARTRALYEALRPVWRMDGNV